MSAVGKALPAGTDQSDAGLFGFYRALDAKGRKTFWACTAGWALDGMDYMMFPLALGTLVAIWGMDLKMAGGISTATLLCSALGGWMAGFASDRIGRVRTMQITIALFALGSLFSAFAQDPTQLLFCRALLGMGFGGEAAVAAVTLSEVVAARYRGRAMGFYQSSYAIGWALALFIQIVAFSLLPPETAWRAMFGLGVLPAILILFIRSSVREPDLSLQAKALESRPALGALFGTEHLKNTILGSLLTIGGQGGFYALTTWLPQFLRSQRGISVVGSTPYLMSLISGCFIGYVTGGWLADRLGRRPVFLIFSAAASCLAYAYTHVNFSNEVMILLGIPLGFFASGYYSAIMPALNELYPTTVRGSGVGFTYNAGRAVGGLFPFLVGAVTTMMALSDAITLFACASYGLMFLTALALRETNGAMLRV